MLLNCCETLRYISIILAAWGEQAGDPTGTGTTSESVYGSPFKDEFHSRLRFSHRCTSARGPSSYHDHRMLSQMLYTIDWSQQRPSCQARP